MRTETIFIYEVEPRELVSVKQKSASRFSGKIPSYTTESAFSQRREIRWGGEQKDQYQVAKCQMVLSREVLAGIMN